MIRLQYFSKILDITHYNPCQTREPIAVPFRYLLVDVTYEEMDGGIDSIVNWDEVAYENGQDYWQWYFLQAMNGAFCSLLTHEFFSFGSYLCNRGILHWQHERDGQRLWEDLKHEVCGTHRKTKQQVMMPIVHGHKHGAAYNAIIYWCLVSLSPNVEYFLLLCASWCCFCQAVAKFYVKQAIKLVCSGLMVGKFPIDENKLLLLTPQNLGASSVTAMLFPRYDLEPFHVTVGEDISLMAFIKAHQ